MKVLLSEYNSSDSVKKKLDEITQEISKTMNVPMVAVILAKDEKKIVKACCGLTPPVEEKVLSFCDYALEQKEVLVVEDAMSDPRFVGDSLVTEKPFIRFYAGVRFFGRNSPIPLGVLCIKDIKPRTFSFQDTAMLMRYGEKIETILTNMF